MVLTSWGQVVVARQRVGEGHLVISALPETYPWLLQNAPIPYAGYWSCLLTAATRPVAATAHWTVTDPWPRPQLPLALRLTAPLPGRQPLVLDAAGTFLGRLPLRQDTGLPEWSTATFWPTAPGWHQIRLAGQPTQWFYVFARSAWQGPETQRRTQSARPWLTSATGVLPALQRMEAWPAGWFFALFVLAAGFLWLEEKL
ncbi:MAG: hypothetical protein H7Z21_10700 [Hymenobacter sp.]|nr:hypothetical protein [Hymenobacter sp.]